MGKTRIEWSDMSWPVVTGCSHAGSPGCDMCYAARMAATRLKHHPRYKGLAVVENSRARWTGEVRLNDVLDQPLHWRKPRRVFVASMGDLFHPDVYPSFICGVWQVMRECPQHTFQILTKRPGQMLRLIKTYIADHELGIEPLPNVWLGVSVENQAAADERRDHLERCPAAVKFVSYEPALGPVDWAGWEFVSQIISGGESGPGARPSHPDWHRATRDFCQENGIAYFFKAWGAWGRRKEAGITLNDGPFGFWDDGTPGCNEWMAGGFSTCGEHMVRVGKKRAGHLLDGRTWQEFPR